MNLKIIAFALTILCMASAHAQKIYVKVNAGTGISNKTATDLVINGQNFSRKRDNISGFTFGISVGMLRKNMDFSVGLQMLSTGEKINDLTFETFTGPTETGSIAYRRRHILIPVRFGYHLSLTKKLSLMPQLGVAYSYTFNTTSHIKTNLQDLRRTYSSNANSGYHSSNVFGSAAVFVEYGLNKLLTISAGPSCYYMITNFADAPAGALIKVKEHPYFLGGEAAISVHL